MAIPQVPNGGYVCNSRGKEEESKQCNGDSNVVFKKSNLNMECPWCVEKIHGNSGNAIKQMCRRRVFWQGGNLRGV